MSLFLRACTWLDATVQQHLHGCQMCTWTTIGVIAIAFLYYFTIHIDPRRRPSRAPVSSTRTVPRGTGRVIPCHNPATGEKLGECHAYTEAEVKQAYERCREAARDWAQTDYGERRALLMDIMDWIVGHQEEIAQRSVAESGKTINEALLGEVMTTCEKIRWIVSHVEDCLRPERRPVATLLAFTKVAQVRYEPLGVIGVIVPWNYPFHNVLSAVVAALAAGNGVVVKVSEWTSMSAEPIETMLREIIARRGFSPDLVQIITGYGDCGAAMIGSGVDKVLFIGSPATGKKVMSTAANTLTPVILELGGKDPFIVFDDVDFDHVIQIAVRGAFINCGQNCIAAERFYVQAGVHDRFVDAITPLVKRLVQGASCRGGRCDFGAITMPAQVDIIESLVNDAVKRGARVLVGGKRGGGDGNGGGLFFEPTVLANVDHSMRIVNEETFGPVMIIMKFTTEEEVIRMCNASPFGLGSSIFTTDYRRADRVMRQLECGMVNINDFAMVPMIQSLPFGGVKESGFGHFNGKEGLRGFSRIKSVTNDRFPLRAAAPKFLLYPVPLYARQAIKAAVSMVFGRSWTASAGAVVQLLKAVMFGDNGNGEAKKKK